MAHGGPPLPPQLPLAIPPAQPEDAQPQVVPPE